MIPFRRIRQGLRFRFKKVWNGVFPSIPLPVRLPYGGWWLAVNDVCSDAVFVGNFEEDDAEFVNRFLRAGMTFVDVGAHHGFYTMLAARKVGMAGQVIAFEPSPRERERLSRHIKLNRLQANTRLSPFALGCDGGSAALYVVSGRDTGCNSLRPPSVLEPTAVLKVKKTTLDGFLAAERIGRVDFVKIDAEGAELSVLMGATRLLTIVPRPLIMVEVDDGRAAPWGHSGSDVYDLVLEHKYQWFVTASRGALVPISRRERYDRNLVAVPQERLTEVRGFELHTDEGPTHDR